MWGAAFSPKLETIDWQKDRSTRMYAKSHPQADLYNEITTKTNCVWHNHSPQHHLKMSECLDASESSVFLQHLLLSAPVDIYQWNHNIHVFVWGLVCIKSGLVMMLFSTDNKLSMSLFDVLSVLSQGWWWCSSRLTTNYPCLCLRSCLY